MVNDIVLIAYIKLDILLNKDKYVSYSRGSICPDSLSTRANTESS